MPRFEIELNDKGDFVGELPAELKQTHERMGIMAHGNGFSAGQAKAAEDAKAQLAEALRAERVRAEAQMPLEREKWQNTEAENTLLKSRVDESRKAQLRLAEEHAAEMTRRTGVVEKRNAKIQALTAATVRGYLAQAGIRDESMAEVEFFISNKHIGFDDDMEPFVKGDDGKPMLTATGSKVPIDAFVKDYLVAHPVHRKPAQGQGGGARGGATYQGHARGPLSEAAAAERFEAERSPDSINDLYLATRRKKTG